MEGKEEIHVLSSVNLWGRNCLKHARAARQARRGLHAIPAIEINTSYYVQGDTSGRTKPDVDMKTKVVFQYKLFILKHNFCFHVNDRFGPT